MNWPRKWMALKLAAETSPELFGSHSGRAYTVPCRGVWRKSGEAYGVSLCGASSSADLGCSSEYSTADYRDGSLKAEVGKGSVSTAIGHGSLGTERNVGPQLWKGKMVMHGSLCLHSFRLRYREAGLTIPQLTMGNLRSGNACRRYW